MVISRKFPVLCSTDNHEVLPSETLFSRAAWLYGYCVQSWEMFAPCCLLDGPRRRIHVLGRTYILNCGIYHREICLDMENEAVLFRCWWCTKYLLIRRVFTPTPNA
eukprot:jgi/Botrbrau1/5854/Bobra.0366s0035.1